jgi:hypothetical protein
MSDMEFVPAVAMLALIKQLIDLLRSVRGGDTNSALTILTAWVAGVGVLLLVAQTDWATGISVGDYTLATLNVASLVFVGISIASGASVVSDTLGAIDTSRSTAKPHLFTDGE